MLSQAAPNGKTGYNWDSYKWGNSLSALTRYCTSSQYGVVDNKDELKDYDYADDAARQILGGNWRIPTRAEWNELRAKCDWSYVDGQGNGTGYKVGGNDHAIHLPVTHTRFDNIIQNYCRYWSSSLGPSSGSAYYISPSTSIYSTAIISTEARCVGMQIRPVTE